MIRRFAFAALLFSLSSALQGQQPAAPGSASAAPAVEPRIIVYKIELAPTGFMFAMNEPVLDGDYYIFRSLPDRTEEKLPKVKVKSVARWSTDYSKEVVWQVDLAGTTGIHLARNEPVKKGRNYIGYTWKNNTLMSVPETDVVKITRLTGAEAFKAEQLALGLIVLAGETPPGFRQDGGGTAASGAPATSAAAPKTGGNWTYQGQPGASDAYAPGNATVAKPGDTPMMPEPTRPPN